MKHRFEQDSMGQIQVPADKYWGAQTQRSLEHFRIGKDKMPTEMIQALAIVKQAAASTNHQLGLLSKERRGRISEVARIIQRGELDDHFPLVIFQTGSGTQTNMNMNEVIARKGNELAGLALLHPNDHVNLSQSSNDTFPSAMHIAARLALEERLLPAIASLKQTFGKLMEEHATLIKVGRTHLQDATPITFGQEISGWYRMMEKAEAMIRMTMEGLCELALGGTAVGTGLNAHPRFAIMVAEEISRITGKGFVSAQNKFHSLSSKDELVFAHGALKALAADLMKIANDVRWLASGPRSGIGEITIPSNEPGSSIMPGKVNPTQAEALTMVVCQVMGNDMTIGFAASQGNFQLNVFMPVIIYNFLQSVNLLTDAIVSFDVHCARGIKPSRAKMQENLERSLMLVTALNPHIGYDGAATIAKKANEEGITLKEAALMLGILSEEEFDRFVRPDQMV